MKTGDKVRCCGMTCTVVDVTESEGKLILTLIDENGWGIVTTDNQVIPL